jgi:septal ring factor EnvC (AmiA/AmiB activator)
MLSKVVISSFAVATGLAVETGKNPIRRVVTLMQDMQKEIQAEGEKEDALYKKFECYCSGNTDNLTKAGEDAAAQIEELSAKIKEEKADKKQTEEELKQHKTDRATAKQDLEKATSIRKKEHETYVAEAGDTKENIDATKGAVKALEAGMGATMFIQSNANIVNKLKSIIATVENVDASLSEASTFSTVAIIDFNLFTIFAFD